MICVHHVGYILGKQLRLNVDGQGVLYVTPVQCFAGAIVDGASQGEYAAEMRYEVKV